MISYESYHYCYEYGLMQAQARCEMAKVDMLLVPTALHHYTVKEIYQEERDNDQVGTPDAISHQF